jgi:hypothetical protein
VADAYFQLTIDGQVQQSLISRCEIRKAFGLHSLVIIDLQVGTTLGVGTSTPVSPEGTPVQVDFGRRFGGVVPWYGYVHHSGVVANTTSTKGTVLQYVLIGTSLPMNNVQTRSWRGTSATALARQVFREHGLRTITSVHPRVLPYWAQAGTSDFALLQALAAETGYRLLVDGPTGEFFNPRILLSSPLSSGVPIYRQDSGRNSVSTLLNFEVLAGHMIPRASGKSTQAVVFGVDKRSGRTLQATGGTVVPGIPRQVLSTKTVDDFSVAQSLADAKTLATQGWVTARADINGNAALNPGMVIDVEGSAITASNVGLWLVSGVTHLFDIYAPRTKDLFTTRLAVERDQLYSATFDRVATISNTFGSSAATMRGSKIWVAQFLEDIRVS